MPVLLSGIAKLEVPVTEIPEHVARGIGAGTEINGLRPGALAADGTVASLKSGVATVLEGGNIGAVLPTKELVSVESVLLAREAASVVVIVGLHRPEMVDVPNGELIGSGGTAGVVIDSGATGGVKLIDGLGVTEEDAPEGSPVLVITTLFAFVLALAEPVTAVAGHDMMLPIGIPEFGARLPIKR